MVEDKIRELLGEKVSDNQSDINPNFTKSIKEALTNRENP
jgi:hypothetical protein